MISRVAEHCFWMARYLERAENTARVLEVNHTLLLDFHVPMEQQWLPILIISGIHDFEKQPDAESVQEYMTWEKDNPFSIISSLFWARENARIIREVITVEMWERINYYHLWIQSPSSMSLYATNRNEFYSQVKRINQLIHGIADTTMSHGEAWDFFKLGTNLERTSQTARIIDVKYHTLLPAVEDVGTPVDNAHWIAILLSCSGYEPFHKKPRATQDLGLAIAEFLIFDAEFPRSIHRCLQESAVAIVSIAAVGSDRTITKPEEIAKDILNWFDKRSILEIIREGLHETLTYAVDSTHRLGNAIHETFFAAEFTPPSKAVQSQSQS